MSLFDSTDKIPEAGQNPLEADEQALLDKVARKVVDKGWTVPAIMFLESVKPLNFISSQAMVFFEPIVQTVFSFKDYTTFRTALEKRESIELLLLKIEEFDAKALGREKRIKKFLKQEKKKWKWYQRYLGVFLPKIEYPEDVLNPPQENKEGENPDSRPE